MEAKFREGFTLFSSCQDKMDVRKFSELINSFGITISNEELSDLPDVISIDFWLEFANKHYNFKNPFESISQLSSSGSDSKIEVNNFIGIFKALNSKLNENDFILLSKIINPKDEPYIDMKTLPDKLAATI